MTDKVGIVTMAAGNVDAASRAYIFQEKILPHLERDVDRALEPFGHWGQFPLVPPPVAMPSPRGKGTNPLINYRKNILALKSLQIRLYSPKITGFLMTDADKIKTQSMARRIADYIHLSNIANAAVKRTPVGYASARKNLESILEDITTTLDKETTNTPEMTSFLTLMQNHYQCLKELCRIYEEISAPRAMDGTNIINRLDHLAIQFEKVAHSIEALDYLPADTMPLIVAINQEVLWMRNLVRWIICYTDLTRYREMSVLDFASEISSTIGTRISPEVKIEIMESYVEIIKAYRGEISVIKIEDFDWVDQWVEAQRKKKLWGRFGTEETADQVHHFMLPVWVAEINFSQSSGGMFAEGEEKRCLAVVDACNSDTSRVIFSTDTNNDLARAMEQPEPLVYKNIALHRSTASRAKYIIEQAAKAERNLCNARIAFKGLAYVSAALVNYKSNRGRRQLSAGLNGMLNIKCTTHHKVVTAQQFFQRFA